MKQADVIHAELVQRSLQDVRLHPLLPLLGVEKPSASKDTNSPATHEDAPIVQEATQKVQTERFTFPNDKGETYSLEEWEVQAVISPKSFKNWVALVNYEPAHIIVVRSLRGVKAVIKWARTVGRKVRGAGFRHTWR